jgi:hypothetical protein
MFGICAMTSSPVSGFRKNRETGECRDAESVCMGVSYPAAGGGISAERQGSTSRPGYLAAMATTVASFQ